MDVDALKKAIREAGESGARQLKKSSALRWRDALVEVREACAELQGCMYDVARAAGKNCLVPQTRWRDALAELESACSELQADVYRARAALEKDNKETSESERELTRKLIGALEFYGNEENWKYTRKDITGEETFYREPSCRVDGGAVAREALRVARRAEEGARKS